MNSNYDGSYAITLTIKPKWYKFTIEEQKSILKNELMNMSGDIDYHVIIELTQSYNVHAHGIIRLKNDKNRLRPLLELKYLHNMFRKCSVIGFIYLKQITNLFEWKEYCYKNYTQTKIIFCYEEIFIKTVNLTLPNYEDIEKVLNDKNINKKENKD